MKRPYQLFSKIKLRHCKKGITILQQQINLILSNVLIILQNKFFQFLNHKLTMEMSLLMEMNINGANFIIVTYHIQEVMI